MSPLHVPIPFPNWISVQVGTDARLWIGTVVLVLLGVFFARLPDIDLRLGLPHRGVTHSILAAACVSFGVGSLVQLLMPAAAFELAAVTGAAYLSHMAADGINPTPEAVFWPLPRYRPRWLPSVREDSWRFAMEWGAGG